MDNVRYVSQCHTILRLDGGIDSIAEAARTCYRSEALSGPDSDRRLVERLIRDGHEAMLEHSMLSVRFTTDRGTSHELVRHRLMSFAQESQRYVASDARGFEFIMPVGISEDHAEALRQACESAARCYTWLREDGCRPEVARAVLPNMTATRIVVTGNFREWRHVLRLRCDSHAHPQMRALMSPLLRELRDRVPVVFDDIEGE